MKHTFKLNLNLMPRNMDMSKNVEKGRRKSNV
jgi:hypothetical protein